MARPKGAVKIDRAIQLPKTREGKIALIEETFASQPLGGWSEGEVAEYMRTDARIEPRKSDQYSDAELDLILANLAAAKMILFE